MTNYLTQEGYARLKKELEGLKTVKRQEIAERLQRSISFGDLVENAEYQEAKEAQALLEGQIMELEQLLESAQIIEEAKRTNNTGVVSVGTTIVVYNVDLGEDKKERFTIVGSQESDPGRGLISNDSPLGNAFLGKQAGSEVEVHAPSGIKKYKILSVEK